MTLHTSDPEPKPSSAGIIVLLLLAIFTTELAVMELLSLLGSGLDRISASLLDAAILVLLFAVPLWFFVVRPLRNGDTAAVPDSRGTPAGLLMTTLGGIFLAEFLVMVILPEILPYENYRIQSLIDAGLTILFSTPMLWWLLHRLELRRRRVSLLALLGPPLRLYVLLLLTIFLVDLLQEQLLTYIPLTFSSFPYKIFDAFLSTLFIAPLLWMLVASPLKKAALTAATRVRVLHDQLIDAIVTIDAQGVIKFINPAAERIFRCDAGQLIGKTAALVLNDNQNLLEELIRDATENSADRNPHIFRKIAGNRQDGSTLYMDVSISKVLLEEREEFLLVMRDVTARTMMQDALRESEERFRQVFDQTEDAIIFFATETCSVLDANSTSERLFGYSREELKESGLGLLGTPAEIARLNGTICSIRRDGITQLEDIVITRKDGTEIFASMHGKVMTLQGDDVIYCTFRDTTERVRLGREAREIQAKLIQANKMTSLGLLVSGVAHEINNPNNFIMANSQLLAESWVDVRKILREYYESHGEYSLGGIPYSELDGQSPYLFAGIIEGSRRINEIINNLKGFARQDRMTMERGVDVNRVATSAVSILYHEINNFTENFHLDLAEGIPGVKGNSQQLGQVIINLLMNACQALPARECGIWLTTGFDAATGHVTIAVRDEGYGMSPDVRTKIMEPFFTTKLDCGGTGLGLSISRSIVKEHRGTLEFVSELGKGTTFIVNIPAGEPAVQEYSQ
jgi:PAS domain S-box-containing protein